MANLVQKVARFAYKTFHDYSITGSVTVVNQRLEILKDLVHQFTSKDVALDERLIHDSDHFNVAVGSLNQHVNDGAPVTYVHIWEDSVVSMGIFIVKSGMRIPLHDHPNMYGILKVVHGTMMLKSFNETSNNTSHDCVPEEIAILVSPSQRTTLRPVTAATETCATINSQPCVLTQTEGNYHEITAIDGPVAFIDILSPPYDHESDSRECHYYKELDITSAIHSKQTAADRRSYLLPIAQPWDFWCDAAAYKGPHIYPDEHM